MLSQVKVYEYSRDQLSIAHRSRTLYLDIDKDIWIALFSSLVREIVPRIERERKRERRSWTVKPLKRAPLCRPLEQLDSSTVTFSRSSPPSRLASLPKLRNFNSPNFELSELLRNCSPLTSIGILNLKRRDSLHLSSPNNNSNDAPDENPRNPPRLVLSIDSR